MRRAWFRLMVIAVALLSVIAVATTHIIPSTGIRSALAAPSPSLIVHGYTAPGDVVRIEGERFIPGETATVSFDTTTVATVKVIQTMTIPGVYVGGFFVSVTIPTNTTTGAHTFSATAEPSGLIAQAPVTLTANWSQYGFTSANTRYNPYETAITAANVSTLSLAWTFTDPNINPAFTYNTPSVSDGGLYIMANQDNMTYSIDASTGAKRWGTQFISYPTGSVEPAVVGANLYTTGYYLTSIATTTGATQWLGMPNFPTLDAPTVANGVVYVTTGGSLFAYNATGCGQYSCAPLWTYTDALGGLNGTPAVANGHVYVDAAQDKLVVLDAATGKLQWADTVTSGGMGTPVVDNGMVFIGSSPGSSFSATLDAFSATGCGASTCNPTWTASFGQAFNYGTLVSLAVGNGAIFIGSTDWNLYAFAENGCGSSTCAPLWKGPTGGMIESAPALANGVVYVGSTDDGIHAFNAAGCGAATCAAIWNYNLGAYVQASPIVVNGMVYITSRSSTLYAFHLPSTPRTGRL